MPATSVLGVSFDYHDAAAALVIDGVAVAAAAEERFTRIKHDPSLPREAMRFCLEAAGLTPDDLDAVVFYGKPLTTYDRVLSTHARVGPRGVAELQRAVAVWSRRKLWAAYRLERALRELGARRTPTIRSAEHHTSHAAAAFYPSPFETAAVLTMDGVGDWATATMARGAGHRLEVLREQRFPDSVGLLYSALTTYCGFDANDGESKLMGLAPFGTPRYAERLLEQVVSVGPTGAVRLDQRWFTYRQRAAMVHPRLARLLDGPPRGADEPLTSREADIAASAQVVLETVGLAAARHLHELTGEAHLCLAGGVSLNCVANRRILDNGPFESVWIQPAAGDDGGALGAALWYAHEVVGCARRPAVPDGMAGALLGPRFHTEEIAAWLRAEGIPHVVAPDDATVDRDVVEHLARGATVGWFQGAMEFGPRALGGRSILADPRDPTMIRRINEMVKGREGFRPFGPAVLEEDAGDYFDVTAPAPYMLLTARSRSAPVPTDAVDGDFAAQLATARGAIPAVTHVDGSARLQTVADDRHPRFASLLRRFREQTGCSVLLNTSFNRRDEPIVRSPAEAYRCFRSAGLDLLAMERCLVGVTPDGTS